ncbi:MAG: HAMP domain-containing protein [Deltaproteobacteria bacterium]|nr:HAMP domain-containing protein [Deltaproteobacteria bacterium]
MPRWRLHPLRNWPLSIKLATTVLVIAVIPLLLVAWINATAVESLSLSRETHNLERRAAAAARRLEERVGRLRAYVELMAENPTILRAMRDAPSALAAPDPSPVAQGWDARHPEIYTLLVSLRRANPWFANVYLLGADGVCIATSERAEKPSMVGRPYDYRPYFQAAIADRAPFVTDVLENANSPGTAIFVSAPVLVGEAVAGVVVLKVDSGALHDVVADLARTGGSALLVDRFGVVVSDAWTGTLRGADDPQSLQFHPFASVARFDTLFRQTRRYGNPDGEHYLDRVQQPLALDSLWNSLQQRRSGAAEHLVPTAFGTKVVATMVGYAPVIADRGEPYGYVVLGEAAASFRSPLHAIARSALLRFGLVAFGVALVIALLIRRFSRQVVDLADGARRLADGERASLLALHRGDELGMLAANIQRLADHAQEAVSSERQARRDSEQARDTAEALAHARTEAVTRAQSVLASIQQRLLPSARGQSTRDAQRTLMPALASAAIDLAALGDDPPVPRIRSVKLPALAEEVVGARIDDAPQGRLTVDVEGEPAAVQTDPDMLRRILEHLVDNACKFTRRGDVRIRVRAHDDGVAMAVVDTGIGLTARQAARISAESTEPIGAGGIGLWVTRRLAHVLGASLEAEGEVGKGSTVTITVPHTAPSEPPTPAGGSPAPASKTA